MPAAGERRGDRRRRGPPVGRAEHDEHRRTHGRARRDARGCSSGTPALPASAIDARPSTRSATSAARRHERAQPRLADRRTAAAARRAYASDGKRVDATHVPLVTAPRYRADADRARGRATEARRPPARREHEQREPAPALLHRQNDQDRERECDGADLGDGQHQLAERIGHATGRPRRGRRSALRSRRSTPR